MSRTPAWPRAALLAAACVATPALARPALFPSAEASNPARLGWTVASPPLADKIGLKEDVHSRPPRRV